MSLPATLLHDDWAEPRLARLRTVQLGKGWFAEESGGLNRYYADLVRHLPGVGVDVSGLVAGSDRVSALSSGDVRAFAPKQASLIARMRGIRTHARAALAEQPSPLAVAHFALYAAPCLDLFQERPFVMHFHGPWAAESRAEGANLLATRAKRALEARVYRRATRSIVLSRAFGTLLARDYRVPEETIRVIPGGVDTARFATSLSRTEARERLAWPNDRPIVLVVRRLVHRMGLENLVESVTSLRAAIPDVLVMIAGSGPLAKTLEARITDAGVSDHVRLLGYVRDEHLPLAYRAADLSVVPSVALEGFGLIVAESLAAGTPVVVTSVGGLPETIEGLAPQCIVGDTRPAVLADVLAAALAGRLPLPSATACREHARQRFDWQVVAARVRDVYTEALS